MEEWMGGREGWKGGERMEDGGRNWNLPWGGKDWRTVIYFIR